MGGYLRFFGIAAIWCLASVGWLVLGGVTEMRKHGQQDKLREGVQSLWGSPQVQDAPQLAFAWETQSVERSTEQENGVTRDVTKQVTETHDKAVLPDSSRIDVDLRSNLQRKGLMWYSLYDVGFEGRYSYKHAESIPGSLSVRFPFPDKNAIYDGFHFIVDGVDHASAVDAADGSVTARLAVQPGQVVHFEIRYKSRGLDSWHYRPSQSVTRLHDFELKMRTHFADIDYPEQTMSPSARELTSDGWQLRWRFEQIVSGFGIGMLTPQRVQPGALASALAFSAPISLFFFFLVVYVLATLRSIDIHPINYAFVAGAFYAFHLLFAYSVDHMRVEVAFALCSLVSVALVVSYLRLAVSSSFAWREAMLAQLIYLIGFSLAYFWEGFTGLTVTVLAIVTLFVLMQLTGRVRWTQVLGGATPASRTAPSAPVTPTPAQG
jgi:hypothetical protein